MLEDKEPAGPNPGERKFWLRLEERELAGQGGDSAPQRLLPGIEKKSRHQPHHCHHAGSRDQGKATGQAKTLHFLSVFRGRMTESFSTYFVVILFCFSDRIFFFLDRSSRCSSARI